jgi:hypothetical protein
MNDSPQPNLMKERLSLTLVARRGILTFFFIQGASSNFSSSSGIPSNAPVEGKRNINAFR